MFSSHCSVKEGRMADFDTLIKGGTIVDGTLVPPYRADVGIKNGKIVKIGKIDPKSAKRSSR